MAVLVWTVPDQRSTPVGPKNRTRRGAKVTTFPVRLEIWTDEIGLLHELQDRDGCLVAKIGPDVVALPYELHEVLKSLVGRKISVFRSDHDYRVRCRDEGGVHA